MVTLHEYLLMQAAIFRQSKTARAINITRIPANAGTVSQLVEYLGQGYIT